jgi:hypothetical protein
MCRNHYQELSPIRQCSPRNGSVHLGYLGRKRIFSSGSVAITQRNVMLITGALSGLIKGKKILLKFPVLLVLVLVLAWGTSEATSGATNGEIRTLVTDDEAVEFEK